MNAEAPSIAKVPDWYKRTSRKPTNINGIEWRSYRSGINAYTYVAEHATSAYVSRNYNRTTYNAVVNGVGIGSRFQSDISAMVAATKVLNNA